MYRPQPYYPDVAIRLHKILGTLGVSERMRKVRGTSFLQEEAFENVRNLLNNKDEIIYKCGSQVECSTTPGLHSDIDVLYCRTNFPVIQSIRDWTPGELGKHIMVADKETYPGYVKLQRMYNNAPVLIYRHTAYCLYPDHRGRSVFPNTCIVFSPNTTRQGPAFSSPERPGFLATDNVVCFHCRSFPFEAYPWLTRQRQFGWPSNGTIDKIPQYGCLLVPVGHRCSIEKDLEWRVSFSLAERDLIKSFNITQLQCYVLLKLTLKSFIKPVIGDVLSSYHCKTCMFYMVENSPVSLWSPENLLLVLMKCLRTLYIWVDQGYCPQYFIPENNLFNPRVSGTARSQLRGLLRQLISEEYEFLLRMEIDQIGLQLRSVWRMAPLLSEYSPAEVKVVTNRTAGVVRVVATSVWSIFNEMWKDASAADMVIKRLCFNLGQLESVWSDAKYCQYARHLFNSFIRFEIGSHLVAMAFPIGQFTVHASEHVNSYLLHGSFIDAMSGRVKFAAILFVHGNFGHAEMIINHLVESLSDNTISHCGCHQLPECGILSFQCKLVVECRNASRLVKESTMMCTSVTECPDTLQMVQKLAALCVMYLPTERANVPRPLWFEMFRSVAAEPGGRNECDFWFDWMVIDSVTYLYYLKLMLYIAVGKINLQKTALQNFAWIIQHGPNLGHRETALNLLGDHCARRASLGLRHSACWTQLAYKSWAKSMKICMWEKNEHPIHAKWYHHNAAKWHLAILLKNIMFRDDSSLKKCTSDRMHENVH